MAYVLGSRAGAFLVRLHTIKFRIVGCGYEHPHVRRVLRAGASRRKYCLVGRRLPHRQALVG